MLILLIKTSHLEAELYLYQDKKCLKKKTWAADRILAETISSEIDQLFKSHNYNLSQVDGVGIFRGPGSFTGLRIGHSVANALAYGLGVPIVGTNGEDWQTQAVFELLSGKSENMVMPEYGALPHTTPQRK